MRFKRRNPAFENRRAPNEALRAGNKGVGLIENMKAYA